jgi:beta-barrel assembly-enhancing protease
MRRRLTLLLSFLLIAAAPAPAGQALVDQLRQLQVQDARVARIAYRLAVAGAPLCTRRTLLTGMSLHSLGQYGRAYQDAARRAFALGEFPAVLALVPSGAADRAGLRAGDMLIAVHGRSLAEGPGRASDMSAVTVAQDALAAALAAPPALLTIRRGGADHDLTLTGQTACLSKVELVPGPKLNAKADGDLVQLTTAVLGEAADDSELAFIIAHEMAHNVLGHAARLEHSGRSAAKIRATEIEADRFGVRLMKTAGYDPHAAARFWARFGKKTGLGIFADGTHQRTRDRVALLEAEASAPAP